MEEEMIVGQGTPYELGATLTLPEEYVGRLPAVVLVQGSGPSDRDSAVYSYKPFRDIAWGLAEQGIAVLRYDKRTYTYGSEMSQEEIAEFTVYEETVEDAILAADLLKKDPRIDANHVYVIGHSLGGMLAPRIEATGGEFAGLIIMAGSPRSLWEIIYDQNMALLALEKESDRQEPKKQIEEEYEKAMRLESFSEEEIKDKTIFGIPAFYFKGLESYDPKELLSKIEKPLLILQGEDDIQVYLEKDFALYEDLLKDRENATLISYPGLNHFFIRYEGEKKGTIDEYQHPGVVHPDVISDMARWVMEQYE
ncbi:hypothetical protein LQ50_03085 [Halalkalibacter okhensis]|uniref:Serine aminopeptidase S33 domain-containing protein n=1 Tax=Halalkalibacter okhensis TaxID=333138 RepID=A0A0B0IK58_9BACI|nr:hypothetical protein LQ50_03085 [Halalkalibacter okhensis]